MHNSLWILNRTLDPCLPLIHLSAIFMNVCSHPPFKMTASIFKYIFDFMVINLLNLQFIQEVALPLACSCKYHDSNMIRLFISEASIVQSISSQYTGSNKELLPIFVYCCLVNAGHWTFVAFVHHHSPSPSI